MGFMFVAAFSQFDVNSTVIAAAVAGKQKHNAVFFKWWLVVMTAITLHN